MNVAKVLSVTGDAGRQKQDFMVKASKRRN
jgi:hypothetical protein